jgi:hypothetical protein
MILIVITFGADKMNKRKLEFKLTRKGVFQIVQDDRGPTRRRVAEPLYLRAIGIRESDNATFAQVRLRTMHRTWLKELFEWSCLMPDKRNQIRARLADLGYDWPENIEISKAILKALAASRPKKRIRIVAAPGWYGSSIVRPGQVFTPSDDETEIVIDQATPAHVGAYIQGEGSLKNWQETIARPSCKSSRLRLAIAAALAATFLRPLNMDSFGLNWFSATSDGKTFLLLIAASVDGLITDDGLPGWADSEPGIEAQLLGHRDGLVPMDETGDADRGAESLPRKARTVAFLLARNRPRKLSKKYQKDHGLLGLDFRNIVLSSSERPLGAVAQALGLSRLGGEEVRLIDVPATEPGSSGIFDGNIRATPGKTLQETTKDLVEQMRVDARISQGHAGPAFLRRCMQDPKWLETLQQYKTQFEAEAQLPDQHNAHYRIRSNFALIYAAAALAIDYGILLWGKKATFRAIEKCMRGALASLQANQPSPVRPYCELVAHLKNRIATSKLEHVNLKQPTTSKQARKRRSADGLMVNGEIFLKPDRLRAWFPNHAELEALVESLKERAALRIRRNDTPTCEQMIGGIPGKPRYYVLKKKVLKSLGIQGSAADH